jgi:thiamine-phosphate pyrophosphorylase
MKLVVVTAEENTENEIEHLKAMLEIGLQTLHIRKPSFSKQEMKSFIRAIPGKYHKKLVLHSHHKLAIKYHLKGIHLPEYHRKSVFKYLYSYMYLYKMMRPGMSISTSFHDIYDIMELPKSKYSYVFLSPVFKSISKKEYKPVYTLPKLQDKLRETKARVFAMGGVEESNLSVCQNVGFTGVGILGEIWQSPDPVEKFNKLHDLCIHNLLPH